MSAATRKDSKSFYVPQSPEFAHKAVGHVLATTEDGYTVVMSLGGSRYQLSAQQADAIAQGLLMSVMRTGLDIASMPWDGGRLVRASPLNGDCGALRFWDDTIHGRGVSFRFFGVCWAYEGEGADPDYPANALCIRTMHDGGILFGKGNADYLLTGEQAYQLFQSLTSCAYSLESRYWKVWDKLIEWRTGFDSELKDKSLEEKALLKHLVSYGRSSKRERRA
ncbi:hypothetical protein [Pseudomonas sp.]|uniref:hypothetical protein n=1 Tax=Pseudomonas sp. TaxID=306 RepID=UPI003FD747C5